MTQSVLISSLGESPAVVTETLDALQREEGVALDVVVTIQTQDVDSQQSSEFLEKILREDYGGKIVYLADSLTGFYDVDSEEASAAFMEKVCGWLDHYQGCDVYLSLAGGRKTMSAIMAWAAQFYPARLLCHVIVDPFTEQEGKINTLKRKSRQEQREILHCETTRLVRLPVVSLFPFLSDILAALRGERIQNRPVEELLERNGLVEKGRPTKAGARILQVLENIGPPPDSGLPLQAKKIVYEDRNRGKHPGLKEYLERLRQAGYVTEIRTYYYNPDLPTKNCFRPATKVEAIEGWYSDGKATTKFNLFITNMRQVSGALKDLNERFL